MKKRLLELMSVIIAAFTMTSVTGFGKNHDGAMLNAVVPIEEIDYRIETGSNGQESIEISLTGYLPNNCYKLPVKIERVRSSRYVGFDVVAKYEPSNFCSEMITPFTSSFIIPTSMEASYLNIRVNPNSIFEIEEVLKL